MNANIELRLVGYDKRTEFVSIEHIIPAKHFELARRTAGVGDDDPNVAYNYPLNRRQVAELAAMVGADIDPNSADFFLEGFATPKARYA